jgi:FHA domain.
MKKVLCPRCDNYLTFDEKKFQGVGVMYFDCQYCGRRFGVRIGSKEADAMKLKTSDAEICGSIKVIENQFCYKQSLPLYLGENIIGRRCKGTEVQVPIISGDMSMDRKHCIIKIKRDKNNNLIFSLKDNESLTGTFLYNEILGKNEWVTLHDTPIVTIGATTFIVSFTPEDNEEE